MCQKTCCFTCIWYLKLNDSPAKSSAEEDEEILKLPSSQKKKSRQKHRRAEARAKKEAKVRINQVLLLPLPILAHNQSVA
ncbi:hypothetical protein ACS0TY_029679 [Phlomoides rotata]